MNSENTATHKITYSNIDIAKFIAAYYGKSGGIFMIKIMFVCHGNICRSPMAEFIFRDMVKKGEIADRFVIKSSATSTEEIWNGIGNPVYPPAKRELAKHGIGCDGKRAVQLKNPTMTSTIISSAWTLIISETLCEFSAMTKAERFAR